MRMAAVDLLQITIPSILLIWIFAFQYLGLPVLYFSFDKYRYTVVTDRWLILQVFVYTSICITMLLLGFCLAKTAFGRLDYFKATEHRPVGYKGRGLSKCLLGSFP